jgi:endonuclease/exonuclease/phosphatase family metal-dependent hydrolase
VSDPAAPVELRVLGYNVRSLRDDPAAVAAVIRASRPDVVCVQEAPRFLRWRSKCAALARESGLVVVTGGRTAGAMLLLCRLGVDVRWRADELLSKSFRLHQRGLAVAGLRMGGRDFVAASFHLSLDAAERLRHVEEITAILRRRADAPVVLAGDVNERPHEPAWRVLAERWQDTYAVAPAGEGPAYELTSTTANPHKRIDGVFADRALEVVSAGVPQVDGIERASDHRPVLALIRLA